MRGAIGSWSELASASLVRPKPSRQDGSEFAGVAATRGPKRRQRLDGVWN